MKNIYKHLNDIDIDLNQFEEMDVNEVEKKKLKNSLKQQIDQNPSKAGIKKHIFPAAMIFTILVLGISVTSQAVNIPGLDSIFSLFTDENYNENAVDVNEATESNGIKFSINEVYYDGKTALITFTIKSKKDLGKTPQFENHPRILHGPGSRDFKISKLDDETYVGMTTLTHQHKTLRSSFVVWQPRKIILQDGSVIKGDWYIDVRIKESDNDVQEINHKVENEQVTFIIDKITHTPYHSILYMNYRIKDKAFKKWDFKLMRYTVEDDLGNEYDWLYKSHTGRKNASYIGTLDVNDEATKLIIKPELILAMADEYRENGSMHRWNNSDAPMEVIKLDDYVIDLQ